MLRSRRYWRSSALSVDGSSLAAAHDAAARPDDLRGVLEHVSLLEASAVVEDAARQLQRPRAVVRKGPPVEEDVVQVELVVRHRYRARRREGLAGLLNRRRADRRPGDSGRHGHRVLRRVPEGAAPVCRRSRPRDKVRLARWRLRRLLDGRKGGRRSVLLFGGLLRRSSSEALAGLADAGENHGPGSKFTSVPESKTLESPSERASSRSTPWPRPSRRPPWGPNFVPSRERPFFNKACLSVSQPDQAS